MIRRLANDWIDINHLSGVPTAPVGATLFLAHHHQVTAKAASSLLRLGPSAFGDPRPLSGGRRHAPAAPVSNPRARPFRLPEAPQGGTMKFNLSKEPGSIHPLMIADAYGKYFADFTQDTLCNYDLETDEVVPRVAESIETAKDGLSITFKINPFLNEYKENSFLIITFLLR